MPVPHVTSLLPIRQLFDRRGPFAPMADVRHLPESGK